MKSLVVCLGVAVWSIAGAAAPSITGTDWNVIDSGGPFFRMTVSGSGFVNGSIAYWGQALLSTGYVSSQQVTADITPELRWNAGTYLLTVRNPDGTVSNQFGIIVSPVLSSVTPSAATAGSKPVTVVIRGIGFQFRLVVQISTAAGPARLATTLIDSGTLTAVIPASALADARSASIQVIDPVGGGASGTRSFQIRATPAIASAMPNPVDAGGGYFLLNVDGSGFAPGVSVQWENGTPLGTDYLSTTQLQVGITSDQRGRAGAFPLTVSDPGTGAVSNPYSLIVAPVLFSLSPARASVGGPALTITATGAGFTSNTTLSMTLGGKQTALATTYVSAGTLTGLVPAIALSSIGSIPIQVNDSAGGGHSLPQNLQVAIAVPVVGSLLPSGVTAGAGAMSLTVNGSNFAAGAVVLWSGSQLATGFVNSTQLTAVVPTSLLQSPGAVSIVVSNSGVQSGGATFTVHPPPPTLSFIAPSSAIAGSAAFTLSVTSTNCGAGCVVQWNGAPLATSVVSATQVTSAVPANLIGYAGSGAIRLVNAEGAASNLATFTVNPPAPTLTNLDPSSVIAGSSPVTLTVSGINFVYGATAQWNGSPLATTFVSSTQLTAMVPASLFSSLLTAVVAVSNPGGATSNGLSVTINAPRPSIASISPASMAAGSGPFVLTINGQDFAANCVVRWNGAPLYTTLASAAQATAGISADLIASGGATAITLANPSGLESSAVTFTITTPVPAIDRVTPAAAPAGAPGLTLTIAGSNFLTSSKARWNGSALATTFVSGGQLKAEVPAELLAAPGLVSVSVSSQGIATATAALFTIGAPLPATATAGIVNAAGSQASVAPGSLISIYGVNLAAGNAAAAGLPLPLSLNGTSVAIGGIAAPLVFVSGGQINAQIPYEVPPGAATLAIQVGTLKSPPVSFTVQAVAPGVLPLIQNSLDGSVNSPAAPVQPGQYITLWVTGQGALDSPIATGDAAPADPIAAPLAPVSAQIGGQDAQVAFAGMAPGLAGLLQVNLAVPVLLSGDQPVVVTVGEVASNRVTVSVSQ